MLSSPALVSGKDVPAFTMDPQLCGSEPGLAVDEDCKLSKLLNVFEAAAIDLKTYSFTSIDSFL